MKGTIANYRRSRHVTHGNQVIVKAEGVDNKESAEKLVGKKVVYTTGKKPINGEVRSSHGNKGALRVLFETGMPGQCLGRQVDIQ